MAKTEEDRKNYQRAYYLRNREKYRERDKTWRAENPERSKEISRKHDAAHRDERRGQKRSHYAANREKELARCRVYDHSNRAKQTKRHSKYRDENREVVRACHKRYEERHPLRVKRTDANKKLKYLYGITLEQKYEMLVEQGGLCGIPGCIRPGAVVDHNHKTGEVRSILCTLCNAGIGMLGEDPKRLAGAIEYLRKFQCEEAA